MRLAGCSSRRSNGAVTPYGGLATTWKGRRGSRRSDASACTTTTARPNSARNRAARAGCRSTAISAGAGVEERPRYRAEAGADIEDERAGREFCVVD